MSPLVPAIIILGPSRWITDRGPKAFDATPLDMRRRLSSMLRNHGASAVVLEDERQHAREDHFGFLLRVLRERDVRSFLVFWPFGARLHGLEVELGHLLTQMEHHRLAPEDVYLLVQRRNLPTVGETLALHEQGNRTRYHEDLIARGCRIRRWDTEAELLAHATAAAWDHRRRHGFRRS